VCTHCIPWKHFSQKWPFDSAVLSNALMYHNISCIIYNWSRSSTWTFALRREERSVKHNKATILQIWSRLQARSLSIVAQNLHLRAFAQASYLSCNQLINFKACSWTHLFWCHARYFLQALCDLRWVVFTQILSLPCKLQECSESSWSS